MGRLFKHEGRWYVAVAVPGKPHKLQHVCRLYQAKPIPLGWFSPLRNAAKSALRSA